MHLILNNHAIHRHRKVKAWRKANPYFHFHFTPTCSSWLNPVEHWFSILQRHALTRGSFAGVGGLRTTLALHCTCMKNLRIGALE